LVPNELGTAGLLQLTWIEGSSLRNDMVTDVLFVRSHALHDKGSHGLDSITLVRFQQLRRLDLGQLQLLDLCAHAF
jgi:hypothetical protein